MDGFLSNDLYLSDDLQMAENTIDQMNEILNAASKEDELLRDVSMNKKIDLEPVRDTTNSYHGFNKQLHKFDFLENFGDFGSRYKRAASFNEWELYEGRLIPGNFFENVTILHKHADLGSIIGNLNGN